MRLADMKTQALRYVVLGDLSRAFRIYGAIVASQPTDLDARTKVADLCVSAGLPELARRVYAAVAYYDLQSGRPLHAVVVAQALASLGAEVTALHESLGQIYAHGAPTVAHQGGGARLSPPDPDADVAPPDLSAVVADGDAAAAAAELAASTTDLAETLARLGQRFPPLPLLSELGPQAFSRVLQAALVHRLPHGKPIVVEGEPGTSFFLVASGQVRVWKKQPDGGQLELARLGEGAVFGELALVHAQPRGATVEVVGEADLVELGAPALAAAAGELEQIAEALSRFTRDRLLRNLLATSPLFKPFSAEERLELAKRFRGLEVPTDALVLKEGGDTEGLYILLAGKLDVFTGEEPFETRVGQLGAGEIFGETALLAGTPSTASVRALQPSTLLVLPRDAFQRLVTAVPELATWLGQLSAQRAATTERLRDEEPLSTPSDGEEIDPEDLLL